MKREELPELHYITPIVNVRSMLEIGILSHNRARKVEHESIAMKEIQDRRAKVRVPPGKPLHDYVNLYIHARNPMMYKRKGHHRTICVLRISTEVLDLPEVVVTDENAATDYVLFAPAPDGLRKVDKDLAFAESWTHSNLSAYYRRKSVRCAEVLVPDRVDPHFVFGAYVSCAESLDALRSAIVGLQTQIALAVDGHMFFQ